MAKFLVAEIRKRIAELSSRGDVTPKFKECLRASDTLKPVEEMPVHELLSEMFVETKAIEEMEDIPGQMEIIGKWMSILSAPQEQHEDSKPTTLTLHTPLKTFKMSGTVGDGSNSVSFNQLVREVETAKTKGHGSEEIIDGVLRAIKSGSELKSYLESREKLTVQNMMSILRVHYKEKDSGELYKELSDVTQGNDESARSYLMRAMTLRDTILKVSKATAEGDEGVYSESLVRSQFKKSVISGFKDDILRSEMRTPINSGINDEELLQELDCHTRQREEVTAKRRSARTKNIEVVGDEEKANDTAAQAIQELQKQVANLQTQLSARRRGGPRPAAAAPRWRCPTCPEGAAAEGCRHCWHCGQENHRRWECPERRGAGPADFPRTSS